MCFEEIQAPSIRIRIFLNPQLFLSGFSFRPHALPANPQHFESAVQSGIIEFANNLEPCGRANPDIFESDDVVKSGLVFIDTNKALAT